MSNTNCGIILDESITSSLLVSKIRDTPSSKKYKSIIEPIIKQSFNYFDFDLGKHAFYLLEVILHEDWLFHIHRSNKRPSELITWLQLWNNKMIVKKIAEKHGVMALSNGSEKMKNDFEIVMTAVKQSAISFMYTSAELKSDKQVVLKLVKEQGDVFKYVSKELQNDREIVLEAVKQNGRVLLQASKEFQKDREIVLASAKTSPPTFINYFIDNLRIFKDDREIVMEAVKHRGSLLQNASKELRNDSEIVLAAVKQDSRVLQYASKQLQKELEMIQ